MGEKMQKIGWLLFCIAGTNLCCGKRKFKIIKVKPRKNSRTAAKRRTTFERELDGVRDTIILMSQNPEKLFVRKRKKRWFG